MFTNLARTMNIYKWTRRRSVKPRNHRSKHIVVSIGRASSHQGQGYLDFSGNMLSTLQALRHFAQYLPSRNILFTFGM
jgi:hypothetical protein